jgi:probable addiction module antidote protein
MKNKKANSPMGGEFKDTVVRELQEDSAFREEYVKDLLIEQDLPMLALGLRDLVEALGGIGKLAKETGLNRQNLYKALSGKVRPDFPTLLKIINFSGFDLSVQKKSKGKPSGHTLALAH